MPAGQLQAVGDNRVVFDGQSLNNFPDGINVYQTFPRVLMRRRRVRWANVAINGSGWTTLSATMTTRVLPQAIAAVRNILIMNGGSTDLFAEGDSAATLYANMRDYALTAKAGGYTHVIALTITKAAGFVGSIETARVGGNALLIANADGVFDAVSDVASGPLLSNNLGPGFSNQTHWSALGAAEAASIVAPDLVTVLAA